MRHAVFALLDDAAAGAGQRSSRLYTGYVRRVRCADPARLDAIWREVEQAQAEGLHALLLADYEWGVRLAGVDVGPESGGELQVLLFRRCRRCSSRRVAQWLAAAERSATPGAVAVRAARPSVDDAGFAAAVARIQQAIRAGETYQVNYSYRLDAQVGGEPLALYRRLRARQPVAYGALIALPADGAVRHVLSFSPELFLCHEGGRLTARPMKGTAPRHADQARDLLAREELASAKSRAENLMIVDLLRNDLGRIAVTGSVKVPALFETEAHATVWQMTSTVSAELAPARRFPEVLRALFPCGSITGAPKHRTMQLIAGLETRPRGLYCGAIGWIAAPAPGRACGDFCLSVPIRTLTLGAPLAGWRPATLGLGAGIVADSTAAAEAAECALKGRFFTGLDGAESGFALIETLRAEGGAIPLLERHLARQQASAEALGFAPARHEVAAALRACAAERAGQGAQRLRLLRFPDGRIDITVSALEANPAEPVMLDLAPEPIDPEAWPLAHKTTLRAPYEHSLARAQTRGLFDLLHVNTRGELTEGARCNLLLRFGDQWLTPALASGVLPGVMRAALLDDPAWNLRAAVLYADDLRRADEIAVCNALRGVLRARLAT